MCQELRLKCICCKETSPAVPQSIIGCGKDCQEIQDDPIYGSWLCDKCANSCRGTLQSSAGEQTDDHNVMVHPAGRTMNLQPSSSIAREPELPENGPPGRTPPMIALEVDPRLSKSARLVLEQRLQELRPVRPAYYPSSGEGTESIEVEPYLARVSRAKMIEEGLAKAKSIQAEAMQTAGQQLDDLLGQMCGSITRMDPLPCDPAYLKTYHQPKKPHPCAAVLEKYGLREPEEWEYWRTHQARRSHTLTRGKYARTDLAAQQVAEVDWPLPLPYERLIEFRARRREASLVPVRQIALAQMFHWRETHDSAFKGVVRMKATGSKRAGPSGEHPGSGADKDAGDQGQAEHGKQVPRDDLGEEWE